MNKSGMDSLLKLPNNPNKLGAGSRSFYGGSTNFLSGVDQFRTSLVNGSGDYGDQSLLRPRQGNASYFNNRSYSDIRKASFGDDNIYGVGKQGGNSTFNKPKMFERRSSMLAS